MPANSPAKATADSSWLRHFWTALAALFLLAGGLIYHYLQRTDNQQKSEAITYLALPIKTIVGNNQYVSGQLSLQITPKQEQLLEERKVMLQTVINATLVEAYGTAEHPSLGSVRLALKEAINTRLPRKLRIRDVLIESLVVGLS